MLSSDARHALLPTPILSTPPPHSPHPHSRPSPVGAVLGEQSPWGQLSVLLFKSQGEAPGQRELGAGALGRGHTRAVVQQLRQGRFELHVTTTPAPAHQPGPPLESQGTAPEPTCPLGQSQPSRQGSCTQRVPGCRCEQRRGHETAQALSTWPGGHSGGGGGAESEVESKGGSSGWAPGWAGTHHPEHSPGQGCRLQSCCCSVSWAWHSARPGPSLQLRCRLVVPPPQGAEQLLQADQGPRVGHSWEEHARDPLTQVLGAGVCRKASEP